MGTQLVPAGSPVTYPSIVVGGILYQLRYTRSATFLLQAWGMDPLHAPALAYAAAMAGFGDAAGNWKSAGFRNPVEFTDCFSLTDDLDPIYAAVEEAIKKVAPKATVTLEASPAQSESGAPVQPS